MYGYSDYRGPTSFRRLTGRSHGEAVDEIDIRDNVGSHIAESSSDEEHNPLQVGFWMDGDSLAPPCGSSVSTIHRLLEFSDLSEADVLYDLGCGDARVCLEAYAKYNCRSFGIEIEEDLVERANSLIADLPCDEEKRLPRVLCNDLRDVLGALVGHALDTYGGDSGVRALMAGRSELIPLGLRSLPLPTIIVVYLLPDAIELIQDDFKLLLRMLPDNFRIICNTWGLKDLHSVKKVEVCEASLALTPLMMYTKASMKRGSSGP
jgi:SAM-dependent methyltransferase